jgi:photoactive yellow protein
MEFINYEGVNLAELLPKIPDSVKNNLPFGLVKLDLTGKVIEYNMAEGELTGVKPDWAMGKNFFDEVATCTKTPAFYGRFVEGVQKGFVNAVFEYVFDHREVATTVKVHMVSVPDHLGKQNIMILVKRANKPAVTDAAATAPTAAQTKLTLKSTNSAEEIKDIVASVKAAIEAAPTTKFSTHEDIFKL